MEPMCDYCGVVRAVVYCKSDSARLCFRCDGFVHSANYLSRRHSRSLLCDKCNSQAAIVRCLDEKMSVCQNCEWSGNGGCSGMGHSRQALSCYSGCPSTSEFSRIWSYVLDVPSHYSGNLAAAAGNWGQMSRIIPTNENCLSQWMMEQTITKGSVGLQSFAKFNSGINPQSSAIPPNSSFLPGYGKDQLLVLPEESDLPKGHGHGQECSSNKNLELHDIEDLCEDLDVDDVALNFDSCDEIFQSSQTQSTYNFKDGGTDCQPMDKNVSVTESNGYVDNVLEASSSTQQECVAFQSADWMQPTSGSGNSMIINPSYNRNINLGYPTGQIPSSISLSLSNITGESSVIDYQGCGLSPMFLTSESPWESSLEIGSPMARDKAKMRYNEKKKTRTFGKQIRYASRKARADTRKRVKGCRDPGSVKCLHVEVMKLAIYWVICSKGVFNHNETFDRNCNYTSDPDARRFFLRNFYQLDNYSSPQPHWKFSQTWNGDGFPVKIYGIEDLMVAPCP